MNAQEFDITLFGATSFVGQICARYLLEAYGNSDVRWAIAARSEQKLNALKNSLGDAASDVPTIVVDAHDLAGLTQLCERSQVVMSTVGPYAHYGDTLVEACVNTGTHYCDLTGELPWIKRMQTQFEAAAQASGAHIVHCCGFDSIPSDIGVHYLQQQARQSFGSPCTDIKMLMKAAKGKFSGGTVASLVNVVKLASKDRSIRKLVNNPYALCPADHSFAGRPVGKSMGYEASLKAWWAPFVMASINRAVVHRSNALTTNSYGDDFSYHEGTMVGDGVVGAIASAAFTAAYKVFVILIAFTPTRWLLEKTLLPEPGKGPSLKEQQEGFYDMRFVGTTAKGERTFIQVTGDRDPGYGSTAKMLVESAMCLAFDKQDSPGGFWTPASLMGDKLLQRLEANAGIEFKHLAAPQGQ